MGLLDKFAAVEVKNEERISAADKLFCEVQQESYDAARQTFSELKTFWKAAVEIQSEIFYSMPNSGKHGGGFLCGIKNLSIKEINEAVEDIQPMFIEKIVCHFNSTYSVSVDTALVLVHLLPEKPDGGRWNSNEEQWKQYHRQMRKLSLRYELVLDEIFLQLGGRNFADRALDELKERCHKAAWNSYQQKADYEVKNDIICFARYACKYTDWRSSGEWEVTDSTKSILRGIAHFETGSYDWIPHGFSELLGWGGIKNPLIEFSTCNKVSQLKMFKNNRVDIKFKSALLAKQFTEEYLGLVC